jgi:site-specific DNA-methyltransferase (adenine-specific)
MPDAGMECHGIEHRKFANTRNHALAAILRRINDSVPLRDRGDLAPFVNWSENTAAPIHRWLRYREAYSPELIAKLSPGSRILDPFCGCGTILLGAAERGYTSTGIDINPLAVFAARVKLTPLSNAQLRAVRVFADDLSVQMASSTPWPVPGLAIGGKVFEPEILEALMRIRATVESGFSDQPAIRDFLHLAWVAILERVGSYFKEGNGIKYRNRKRQKTGYVLRPEGQWQQKRFGTDQTEFVLGSYLFHLRMMIRDTSHWQKGRWWEQVVIEGNALEMDRLLAGQTFNSIVFSPPYANRFDYFESMKVELWFGGFVDSYQATNQLRKASLRSHLGANLKRAYERFEPLEKLIELMDPGASSWRMGVPDLLRGYFDDMRQTLMLCRKALRDGHCFVVVGNSAFAGVIIPTDVLIAKLGLETGFKEAEVLVTRHLTVSPQQRNQLSSLEDNMRESVVVLSL